MRIVIRFNLTEAQTLQPHPELKGMKASYLQVIKVETGSTNRRRKLDEPGILKKSFR